MPKISAAIVHGRVSEECIDIVGNIALMRKLCNLLDLPQNEIIYKFPLSRLSDLEDAMGTVLDTSVTFDKSKFPKEFQGKF